MVEPETSKPPFEDARPARWHRATHLIVAFVLTEVGLAVLTHFGPALGGLTRPLYPIVAGVFALLLWHSWRRRHRQDRRHTDRRHLS